MMSILNSDKDLLKLPEWESTAWVLCCFLQRLHFGLSFLWGKVVIMIERCYGMKHLCNKEDNISGTWGKQKETLVATYKAVMRPTLEYASSIWSLMASPTSINKLQVMQNTALIACTGCTHDTNIQHMHDETKILPIQKHLQLHASQVRQ